MNAGYAALVSDDEISTREATELLGVSLDTVYAMIRDGRLPARLVRGGAPGHGRYVLQRGDVEAARDNLAAGLRVGQERLSEADRADLAEVRAAEAEAVTALERAYAARAALVARLGRKQCGTGAIAKALGVDRSTVQSILREADVPVVHHRQHTELTGREVAQLRRVQADIATAQAGVDKAHEAREALTRELLERGGYGVGSEIATLLGRHRSRLLSPPRRRRQG